MMSIKGYMAIPCMSKLSSLVTRTRSLLGQTELIVLAYHRINEVYDRFLFDEDVVSAAPLLFESQIKFCKKNFNPITFSYLKKCIDDKQTLPKRPIIITFDDGYRDNFTNAFPILQKYDVPATIFLTVHNIETSENFWWDEVNYCLKSRGKAQKSDINSFLRLLKSVPNGERIKEIEKLINVSRYSKSKVERQVLIWKEIREMSGRGIEFGSHSMTHPVLSQLGNVEEVRYELEASKKIIESKLNKEVMAFSYPVGREDSFNSEIKDILEKVGYSFAVNYMHGVNSIRNGFDRFSLRRLDMDQVSLDRFKAKLGFPGLFKR